VRRDIFIQETESIKGALKKLDKTAEKVVLVVDGNDKLLGALTDGDVRRYILKGESLDNDIRGIYNKSPFYIRQTDYSIELAKSLLLQNKIELIPVVDNNTKVIDFVTWKQAFADGRASGISESKIDIPVVIMAGGKSTRLEPFSRILPKPLIPVGDKPVIEIIIDEFSKQGAGEFYLILNYKAEMIESYLNNIEKGYAVKYMKEGDFLGTIGGLKLLEDCISDTFIVSNCDVIVRANFEEVVSFHKEQNAFLTILSSVQHYKIPYGVMKFEAGGNVLDILEKPEYTCTINTGVYVFNKEALQFIPDKSKHDTTDLIRTLIKNHKKVVTYPVNESDYIDIGQWEEYKNQ